MKRKVLAVTGIRSEYDIIYSVFRAIDLHPFLSIEIIVTGAHLADNYGYTINQIEEDGFKIADKVENLIDGDRKSSRVKGMAIQLAGLVQTVSRINPDFLLVLGDREESITTALTGVYMDVPVVHICGGDKVIGNIDDVVRHAVTKLAHIHFTTNEESKNRIIKLGEEPFRVINSGNPGLDRFSEIAVMKREDLFEWYNFRKNIINQPLLVVVQHVLSSENDQAYFQMRETMEAVKALEYPAVISYPNSDAGSQGLIKCIEEYRHLDNIRIFQNVPRYEFVNTLRCAACLIGNSSLGCLEAPFLKLPTINVGNRQKGRLHGDNIVFVSHDRYEIEKNIKKACYDEAFISKVRNGKSPYGDGKSSKIIADVLSTVDINERLLIKEITY